MSAIIFGSFKSLYNYYYEIGKNWTSPNQAMPEKWYACEIKIKKEDEDPTIIKGFFTERGWADETGLKIQEGWNLSVIEWKYAPQTKGSCEIL